MKNVLIVSPHADDEILSSWTYLLLSREKRINLHIIYQAINEGDARLTLVDQLSNTMKFSYDIAFEGYDAIMDKLCMMDVVSYYDKKIDGYDEVIIPSRSFHQDHYIANRACISALRRNNKSSILMSEHPFNISYFVTSFHPNRYVSFRNIDEKIYWLKKYKPYLKQQDIDTSIKLNSFRGEQIEENYAETFEIVREICN
jgi:hypothetical protein